DEHRLGHAWNRRRLDTVSFIAVISPRVQRVYRGSESQWLDRRCNRTCYRCTSQSGRCPRLCHTRRPHRRLDQSEVARRPAEFCTYIDDAKLKLDRGYSLGSNNAPICLRFLKSTREIPTEPFQKLNRYSDRMSTSETFLRLARRSTRSNWRWTGGPET